MSGPNVLLALIALGVVCVGIVLWHARRRLRLSRDAVRDTEWPGQGG